MGGVIHALLSGKGGAGKSYFASVLAQYLEHRGLSPLCFDIDPVNGTLASVQGLQVKRLDVMSGDEIDRRKFDLLIDEVCSVPHEHPLVVDSGSSTFVPLSAYLNRFRVPELLARQGRLLVLHAVVLGGQSQEETLRGVLSLLGTEHLQQVPIVVWVNPFFGLVLQEGRTFEQMRAYTDHPGRYAGVVYVPTMDELTEQDILSVLDSHETLAGALGGPRPLMVKERLHLLRAELFSALDAACLADVATHWALDADNER